MSKAKKDQLNCIGNRCVSVKLVMHLENGVDKSHTDPTLDYLFRDQFNRGRESVELELRLLYESSTSLVNFAKLVREKHDLD